MSASDDFRHDAPRDIRQRLIEAVEHLDHVLPGQAPILNFVHHNTLHGYQHLPFTRALEASERLTGIHGYLSDEEFRRIYARGRIEDADLDVSIDHRAGQRAGETLACVGERAISRREVWRIALIYGIEAIERSQLNWQIEEFDALGRFQTDVPAATRMALSASAQGVGSGVNPWSESAIVNDLWRVCLSVFDLDHLSIHPEVWAGLSAHQVQGTLSGQGTAAENLQSGLSTDRMMCKEVRDALDRLCADLGEGISFRGLLLTLTGVDLLDEVRPILIRFCASHLDEGLAAWHSPDRKLGLYAAWRRCADTDLVWTLADLPTWRTSLSALPEDPVDAVIFALNRLEIPENRWEGYLRHLALEIPGWSGLINWRHHHPEYPANQDSAVALMDYLALRLCLDMLWIERICRDNWGLAGRLTAVRGYFERNLPEFAVRRALFADDLPEYLAAEARALIDQQRRDFRQREDWRTLAGQVWIWEQRSVSEKAAHHTVSGSAWRLFRLAQHLALSGSDIAQLTRADIERLLGAVDELGPGERGYVWLWAYEHHYRESIFAALVQNHGRGRWARRETRPQVQVIFCMDDREESIRRHLEELNPAVETLGAAGFFGVAMNWRGLDDSGVTPLCPVVVTPAHEVREQPRQGQEAVVAKHRRRRRVERWLKQLLNQEVRRNLISSGLLINALSPGILGVLVGKVFFPHRQAGFSRRAAAYVPQVVTRLHFIASGDSPAASPEKPRLGFTDAEQADRVTGFLRNVGLTSSFAPLVLLCGHGSISQNNPHLAAYDCGACSGRHGGPNARAFAAMANRPEVRALVAERGISIPDDTWFIGTEHNTANEEILWFDLEDLPEGFRFGLGKLRSELDAAVRLSAHERCRRFASAPHNPGLSQALNHVVGRTVDFSQARPELGHATNAAALIGRRSVTQGVFFDRRMFLISYDPTQDPDGKILEGILIAVGPVGAGINLEYYFSTVNNDRFGCGSKVPHNVTGLFGVMEGASSDLRTGLPRQMIEIHEAMRLQVIVEASEEVLAGIYQRQEPLRELIGNGWLLLSTIHPEKGTISVFEPERGFVPWCGRRAPLAVVENSMDWYAGHTEPLPPALIGRSTGEFGHAG